MKERSIKSNKVSNGNARNIDQNQHSLEGKGISNIQLISMYSIDIPCNRLFLPTSIFNPTFLT